MHTCDVQCAIFSFNQNYSDHRYLPAAQPSHHSKQHLSLPVLHYLSKGFVAQIHKQKSIPKKLNRIPNVTAARSRALKTWVSTCVTWAVSRPGKKQAYMSYMDLTAQIGGSVLHKNENYMRNKQRWYRDKTVKEHSCEAGTVISKICRSFPSLYILLSPLIPLINMKHTAHLKASSSLFGSTESITHTRKAWHHGNPSCSAQSRAGGLASSNTVTLMVTTHKFVSYFFIVNNLIKLADVFILERYLLECN